MDQFLSSARQRSWRFFQDGLFKIFRRRAMVAPQDYLNCPELPIAVWGIRSVAALGHRGKSPKI
jgi:hypothetical protein